MSRFPETSLFVSVSYDISFLWQSIKAQPCFFTNTVLANIYIWGWLLSLGWRLAWPFWREWELYWNPFDICSCSDPAMWAQMASRDVACHSCTIFCEQQNLNHVSHKASSPSLCFDLSLTDDATFIQSTLVSTPVLQHLLATFFHCSKAWWLLDMESNQGCVPHTVLLYAHWAERAIFISSCCKINHLYWTGIWSHVYQVSFPVPLLSRTAYYTFSA